MRFLGGKNAYLALARLLGLAAIVGLLAACFPKTDEPVFSSEDATAFERDASYTAKPSPGSNAGAQGMSFRFTAVDGKDFMLESYSSSNGKLDVALFIGRMVEIAPHWRLLELSDRLGSSQRIYVLTRWEDGGFSVYAPLEHKTMSAMAARHNIALSSPKLDEAGTFSGTLSPTAFKAMYADVVAHIESGATPKPAIKLDYVAVPDLPGEIGAQGRRKIFETLSGAFPVLMRAAEAEHQQAMRRFMEKLAQAGDPWGSYFLARIHGNGVGVPLDWAQAKTYAEQAVERGNERAKLLLGYMLRNGENSTAADQDRAFQLLTDAANAGDGTAMTNLAIMHLDPKDPRHDELQGYSWQLRAAVTGEVNALYMVALRLRDGIGTGKSETEAFKTMSLAAKLFHPDALAELGLMYEKGQGTAADEALAVAQYRQAARLGNSWAQWQLGDRLLTGRGVQANEAEGRAWLQKAAAGGSTEAAAQLKRPSVRGKAQPNPDMEELAKIADDFLNQQISKLDKDIDKLNQELVCLEVGDRCKLNRNGKALLRLQHAQGWYFADGAVADPSEWPQ